MGKSKRKRDPIIVWDMAIDEEPPPFKAFVFRPFKYTKSPRGVKHRYWEYIGGRCNGVEDEYGNKTDATHCWSVGVFTERINSNSDPWFICFAVLPKGSTEKDAKVLRDSLLVLAEIKYAQALQAETNSTP